MYIGLQWLINSELPDKQYQAETRHCALSQMVLIGSHHLMEVMLFQCIRKLLKNNPGKFPDFENRIEIAPFAKTFDNWPEKIIGKPFNKDLEPLKSALVLAERRNATVHKQSAITTLEMARASLYTAVEASRAIANHLLGEQNFKYDWVLLKHPISKTELFGNISLPQEVNT